MTEDEARIKLTNEELYNLVSKIGPGRPSFDKLQQLSVVSGKTQYWVFRIWNYLTTVFDSLERARYELIKRHCRTNDKGQPVIIEGKCDFIESELAVFQESFNELMKEVKSYPFRKITVTSDLLEKMNDSPKNLVDTLSLTDMKNLEKIVDFKE